VSAENIPRSELLPAVRRRLEQKERHLERRATRIWTATNSLGERFMYARMGLKRDPEHVIATLAYEKPGVSDCWIPTG